MPKLVGKATIVVQTPDGLTIEECIGNVATKEDTLSVARVTVQNPTQEPWLTLQYDEWICVTRGRLELHAPDGSIVHVTAGETAFVAKGERFQPIFPVGDTEYIPVCLPAFSPERCLREETGESEVAAKLRELHSNDRSVRNGVDQPPHQFTETSSEILYHMCKKSSWDQAQMEGRAYFPPTFVKDGMFTHATAVPERLITTANHFYTAVEGPWITLELNRNALLKHGIMTIDEQAKPVGDTYIGSTWDSWICPHVYVRSLFFGFLRTFLPTMVQLKLFFFGLHPNRVGFLRLLKES
jgi:mannose-6-phosphate isomerase-like protein (cupin superfamily)